MTDSDFASSGSTGAEDERRFLASYDPSAFDRPSLAVDVVILSVIERRLEVVLVERREHPHRGRWALPGGFVHLDESLGQAAKRVLEQKAGLKNVYLEQLYTFGDPARDPRTRVVSVAYVALVDPERLRNLPPSPAPSTIRAVLDVPWTGETGGAVEAAWPAGKTLELAFDHADILGMAVKRIRGKLSYTPIGFQLLPETFTLRRLQDVHETVLGRSLNKDSFRRRMLASELLEATGERESEVGHRPAELYRIVKRSAL